MKLLHRHSEKRQQTMSEKNIQSNEKVIKEQEVKELIRGSVEETLTVSRLN